jgi:hypothetical protein
MVQQLILNNNIVICIMLRETVFKEKLLLRMISRNNREMHSTV